MDTYSFYDGNINQNGYCIPSNKSVFYSEIYHKKANNKNDYSLIENDACLPGIYFFVESEQVIYVGEAHDRCLLERVKQHFKDGDTGGLRRKLTDAGEVSLLSRLEKSELFLFPMQEATKREILFAEKYLIGLYRPIINYFNVK